MERFTFTVNKDNYECEASGEAEAMFMLAHSDVLQAVPEGAAVVITFSKSATITLPQPVEL